MRYKVTDADTAVAVGSGDVPALATPQLITWMEAETVRAAKPFTTTSQTTVGTAIRIEHLRATRVGELVEVTAEPSTTTTARRRLTFLVRAVGESGEFVAAGEIDRAIVDRQRFLTKMSGSKEDPQAT